MGSYLSERAGCLYRQTAGSWNVLDTLNDVIICQQLEDSAMFQNLPWDSMKFCGIPWSSVGFHEVLWDSMGFLEVL
jgi:hypothetical protein